VGVRFSAPDQTGLGAHPASCAMGTGSFPGVESGWGCDADPSPLLVPKSIKQIRAIPLLSLRAFVACKISETYLNLLKQIRERFSYRSPKSPKCTNTHPFCLNCVVSVTYKGCGCALKPN
jgi:hypothetical protein